MLLPPVPTVRVPPPDTTPVSPLTPRRAFLYSFLAPGYSQSVLGRNKAATGFLLFEAISLAMIRESAADVREARRLQNDTVVVSWVDASGRALAVPDTAPILFGDREVRSRRAHVEDWIAVLVANHLFAGADAYVAAHLWDVKARVGMRVAPSRGDSAARLHRMVNRDVRSSAPIGVFDSGIGGLTVAHEIIRQLPRESIVYFGDTARVPYGPKSPDTVRRYSREITAFLRDEGVEGAGHRL